MDFSRPLLLSVKSGEQITLNCPFGDLRKAESVVWYKLVFGEMPQKVGERLSYEEIKIFSEFKASGFKMEPTDNGISLTIPHMKKEHGGLYYCEKSSIHEVRLSSGTFVAVTGK